MTNKDGISVEGAKALTEPLEDAIRFLAAAHVPKLVHHVRNASHAIEVIAHAYLALSEREAAKDAEIAEVTKLRVALLRIVMEGTDLGATPLDTTMTHAAKIADEALKDYAKRWPSRAALTKGQVDEG